MVVQVVVYMLVSCSISWLLYAFVVYVLGIYQGDYFVIPCYVIHYGCYVGNEVAL